jgi:hypothetical protein
MISKEPDMEIFRGQVHLPGDSRERDVELSIDWAGREASVNLKQASGGFADWPGLLVQTLGIEEITFRTKGIPPLFTHWWHLMRNTSGDLWGLVVATPDVNGQWRTCSTYFTKVK